MSFSGGRVRDDTQARRGGKRAGVSCVGRVRRRVAKAGNCLRGGELSASRACGCGREARRGAGGGGLGDRGRGLGPPASGRPTRRRATNRLAELEPGRRRRGSMSSRVRPDGAAALLAGGPVRARRARREVDGWRFFVDKGQFTADVRAVVVTVRGRVHRATEWYLRKIVVMPLSRRGPPARLVRFRQTFAICSHGQESGVPLRPACDPVLALRSPALAVGRDSAIL